MSQQLTPISMQQQLGIQAVRLLLAHPLGLDPRRISDPQLEAQFRQLQNVIARSMILCEGDELSVDESWLSPAVVFSTSGKRPLTKQLESQEKEMIEAALAESKGVESSGASGAAAKLAIPPPTLESKIRALKIDKRRFISSHSNIQVSSPFASSHEFAKFRDCRTLMPTDSK